MKYLLCILTVLLFSACAPKLYHANIPENGFADAGGKNSPSIFFNAKEDGASVEIPEDLQNAYRNHLQDVVPSGCALNLSFDGQVQERYASLWYLGVFILLPLWPAMPREDDISILLKSDLVCDSVTVESAELREEEHPRLFWYGPYRNGYVQERADMIHQKLIARLRQSLLQNTPVDESIRSDFY
ncbi:MAG: hypothetical protein J6Z31_04320 [Fibrobacter sp.]|nr:hypothetical protein [Fibrobacter sp.]